MVARARGRAPAPARAWSQRAPVRDMTEQIAQMADAICAGDDDPLLRKQAAMIAENQLWLSCVKAEKVAIIDHCEIQQHLPDNQGSLSAG